MSIEDLAEINVFSVSKSDQPLREAPAAIYVISRDDVIRSGAVTLPEMLRLAPNLQVYQTSPSDWVVTARGLNGNRQAQSFSNKLLVLIDGRPVYSPLFSGVYWDLPQVLPGDIDRIEVVSGPGATLWGSNAVNGVINVITRQASQSDGLHADLRAGPDRRFAGLRLSGTMHDDLAFRVHGQALEEDAFLTAAGTPADDGWDRLAGGFRIDWTPGDSDAVSLQGEVFDGRVDRGAAGREAFSGRNLTLRWDRQLANGALQAQVFYDRITRDSRATGGGKFYTDTIDAEVQHNFAAGTVHQIVWGAGARLAEYDIQGTPAFFFDPSGRDLFIANAFIQDNMTVAPGLVVTAGLKLEHLPYAGTSLLPEARIAWQPSSTTLLWASAARAIRSPTPFDVDVEERAGPVSISGNPAFRTEKLTALELGARFQPVPDVSVSANLFYHRYDDLRSIEIIAGPALLPLGWGNGMMGKTYGVEAWADVRVADWWTLSGGATVMEQDLAFAPGSSGLLGVGQAGNDPPYWLTLRSSMNPARGVTVDFDFRAVGALQGAPVPAYEELGGRVSWQVAPQLVLSVSGSNLLHKQHLEYLGGDLIPRRVLAGVELQF